MQETLVSPEAMSEHRLIREHLLPIVREGMAQASAERDRAAFNEWRAAGEWMHSRLDEIFPVAVGNFGD